MAVDALKAIRGKVAIANAKIAYQHYLEVSASARWQALAEKGAMPQRLLWASIGIDPFDQPDVEDAKIQTRQLIDKYEQSGQLEPETAFFEDGDFAFFAPTAIEGSNATAILKAHFGTAKPNDYAGFLVYCERNDAHEAAIEAMRVKVRDSHKIATVAGFGPRFLHSTGQAYKGGPKEGIFLEITREPMPAPPATARQALSR